MAALKFLKDPSAILDYKLDWSKWLSADDVIVSATAVSDDPALTVDAVSSAASETVFWLSGGTAGSSYKVLVHIVTEGGREDERTVVITVKDM